MLLLPPEEGLRRTALFQRENRPEETRESRAVDWEAASPDSKSMDLARVWSSALVSDLGGVSVAVEVEDDVAISFPISFGDSEVYEIMSMSQTGTVCERRKK